MLYTRKWLSSYCLILRWQALRLKPVLPFLVVIQPFLGIATVIGLGYFLPQIDAHSAIYFATGAATITLISLGLTLMPQMVAQAKAQGTFDYMWSLPVPRMTFLAAEITVWLLVAIPGMVLSLLVGSWRYDFELQVDPLVVPAVLLVALTATAIGYAIVHLSPNADIVPVVTNFLVFCLFLFSPINFPAERLPNWLATLHRFLPLQYAADAIRGTLTVGFGQDLGLAFAVLGIWCVVALGTTYLLVTRRR